MTTRLPAPVLVVLVGPSAAGKSHWAAEHFRPTEIVSADALRAVVGEGERDLAASNDAFAVLEAVVDARARRRLTTVIDTLGMDDERRRRWRELAATHGIHCVAVVFETDAAECRRRNAARPDRVPAAVLTAQITRFAGLLPGLAQEGFAEILAPEPVRVVPPEIAAAARTAETTRRKAAPDPGSPLPSSTLRFGLHLSAWPKAKGELSERLSDAAKRAERVGFDSIWVMDHFRQIPQVGRAWEDMPESIATLGFLAAATSKATIGALVNGITYRNIAHLGKIVATLDVLSDGRARCGLGAGWFEAEHTAYGWGFPETKERLDLLEDALRLLPVLWGPGSKPFTGKRISVPETMCYPRPRQEHLPILVGGSGEKRTLRLVAELADACNLMGDAATVARKLAVLKEHCAQVGRDPATIEVTHLSSVRIGEPRGRSRALVGTVGDHVLRAEALREAGVQHLIVSLDDVWEPGAIERFGEVIHETQRRVAGRMP